MRPGKKKASNRRWRSRQMNANYFPHNEFERRADQDSDDSLRMDRLPEVWPGDGFNGTIQKNAYGMPFPAHLRTQNRMVHPVQRARSESPSHHRSETPSSRFRPETSSSHRSTTPSSYQRSQSVSTRRRPETPSNHRSTTPSSYQRSQSGLSSSEGDGSLPSDECSSSEYSEDFSDEDWADHVNADCMNALFNKNPSNASLMDMIRCKQAGCKQPALEREFQTKLSTIPLPVALSPTTTGLESAMEAMESMTTKGQQALIGKWKLANYGPVEDQIIEKDEEFDGSNLPSAYNMIPGFYRSLFESPSEYSSQDEDEPSESRHEKNHKSREPVTVNLRKSHIQRDQHQILPKGSLPNEIMINTGYISTDSFEMTQMEKMTIRSSSPDEKTSSIDRDGLQSNFGLSSTQTSSCGKGSGRPVLVSSYMNKRNDYPVDEHGNTDRGVTCHHGLDRIMNPGANRRDSPRASAFTGVGVGSHRKGTVFETLLEGTDRGKPGFLEDELPSFDEGYVRKKTNDIQVKDSNAPMPRAHASPKFAHGPDQDNFTGTRRPTVQSERDDPSKKRQIDTYEQENPSFDELEAAFKQRVHNLHPPSAKDVGRQSPSGFLITTNHSDLVSEISMSGFEKITNQRFPLTQGRVRLSPVESLSLIESGLEGFKRKRLEESKRRQREAASNTPVSNQEFPTKESDTGFVENDAPQNESEPSRQSSKSDVAYKGSNSRETDSRDARDTLTTGRENGKGIMGSANQNSSWPSSQNETKNAAFYGTNGSNMRRELRKSGTTLKKMKSALKALHKRDQESQDSYSVEKVAAKTEESSTSSIDGPRDEYMSEIETTTRSQKVNEFRSQDTTSVEGYQPNDSENRTVTEKSSMSRLILLGTVDRIETAHNRSKVEIAPSMDSVDISSVASADASEETEDSESVSSRDSKSSTQSSKSATGRGTFSASATVSISASEDESISVSGCDSRSSSSSSSESEQIAMVRSELYDARSLRHSILESQCTSHDSFDLGSHMRSASTDSSVTRDYDELSKRKKRNSPFEPIVEDDEQSSGHSSKGGGEESQATSLRSKSSRRNNEKKYCDSNVAGGDEESRAKSLGSRSGQRIDEKSSCHNSGIGGDEESQPQARSLGSKSGQDGKSSSHSNMAGEDEETEVKSMESKSGYSIESSRLIYEIIEAFRSDGASIKHEEEQKDSLSFKVDNPNDELNKPLTTSCHSGDETIESANEKNLVQAEEYHDDAEKDNLLVEAEDFHDDEQKNPDSSVSEELQSDQDRKDREREDPDREKIVLEVGKVAFLEIEKVVSSDESEVDIHSFLSAEENETFVEENQVAEASETQSVETKEEKRQQVPTPDMDSTNRDGTTSGAPPETDPVNENEPKTKEKNLVDNSVSNYTMKTFARYCRSLSYVKKTKKLREKKQSEQTNPVEDKRVLSETRDDQVACKMEESHRDEDVDIHEEEGREDEEVEKEEKEIGETRLDSDPQRNESSFVQGLTTPHMTTTFELDIQSIPTQATADPPSLTHAQTSFTMDTPLASTPTMSTASTFDQSRAESCIIKARSYENDSNGHDGKENEDSKNLETYSNDGDDSSTDSQTMTSDDGLLSESLHRLPVDEIQISKRQRKSFVVTIFEVVWFIVKLLLSWMVYLAKGNLFRRKRKSAKTLVACPPLPLGRGTKNGRITRQVKLQGRAKIVSDRRGVRRRYNEVGTCETNFVPGVHVEGIERDDRSIWSVSVSHH